MRIGLDIDGVLADFNQSFIKRTIAVTGKDLFPPCPFDIPTWDYPQFYSYTDEEMKAVWANIKADRTFWFALLPYSDTASALVRIGAMERWHGYEFYFVTARPGIEVKKQTEMWLQGFLANGYGSGTATVLISSEKGMVAKALNLDVYIDDKLENALDVSLSSTKSFLLTRPWNRNYNIENTGIVRLNSLQEFFSCIEPSLARSA